VDEAGLCECDAPNKGSLSVVQNTSSGKLKEKTREPVVDAHLMGGMMTAQSLAAVCFVTWAGEHVHELTLCEREDGTMLTESAETHVCCEPAKGSPACAWTTRLRVRRGEKSSLRSHRVSAEAPILSERAHF
jgi:hypothetical protein